MTAFTHFTMICRFGFPWEIGMYWNLTVGGLNQRAMGCPGLDAPFGTIDKETELGQGPLITDGWNSCKWTGPTVGLSHVI